MSSITPRRIALVVVATIGLLFFTGMLLSGHGGVGSTGVAIIGPVGAVVMWLPYLPVSAAIVAFAVHFWPPERGDAFIFAAGMVLSVAVLVWQLLVLDRKRRLLDVVSDAARRDAVTGLANRRLLDERLAHAVRLHPFLAVPVSLLRVRVDDFKVVNETLGYDASDKLLRNVGARIDAGARGNDIVARMGGDEFAVLVEDRREVAAQLAERLARSFDSPLELEPAPGIPRWRRSPATAVGSAARYRRPVADSCLPAPIRNAERRSLRRRGAIALASSHFGHLGAP